MLSSKKDNNLINMSHNCKYICTIILQSPLENVCSKPKSLAYVIFINQRICLFVLMRRAREGHLYSFVLLPRARREGSPLTVNTQITPNSEGIKG